MWPLFLRGSRSHEGSSLGKEKKIGENQENWARKRRQRILKQNQWGSWKITISNLAARPGITWRIARSKNFQVLNSQFYTWATGPSNLYM